MGLKIKCVFYLCLLPCSLLALSSEEIDVKIKAYLEKDRAIQKHYPNICGALPQYTPVMKKKPLRIKGARVAIDPGHFGGEYATLEQRFVELPKQEIRLQEGDLTFLTALELKRLLEAEGAVVYLSRPSTGRGALKQTFEQWLEKVSNGSFRHGYNQEDLHERARLINDFSPDLTIIIHYNTHLTDEEETNQTTLTQTNFNMAFVPGAFKEGELEKPRDCEEFIRLIVTDDIEESIHLCECIVANFVNMLDVPLVSSDENISYLQTSCIYQKPGIYCRNLALTRLIHGPLCYGETLCQNNDQEIYRLTSHERTESVAKAYFAGIKEYLLSTSKK